MWLWLLWVVLGFGDPWSVGCSCLLGRVCLADVRLLGWVGMLMGGVEPRAIAHLQEEPMLWPLCSGEGEDSHPLSCVQNCFVALRTHPLRVAPPPPAVSRCWSSFFLSLHLLDADPKAPLPLASVVLVLGLKQHWAQAPDPIILGSGIWTWERPGLEEFLANGKIELQATPCLAHLRG